MTVPGSPLTDLAAIYDTYDITEPQLQEILKVPYFQDLFKNAITYFKSQGNRAGAIFRATSLAQALSEKLFTQAMNEAMEAKDSLKLLELLFKASGALNQADGQPQVNTQVNVGVNLPLPQGLSNPKLKHLTAS